MTKKLTRFGAALLSAAALIAVFWSADLPSAQTATRTTAVFRDLIYIDGNGNPTVGSDRIRSDGKGPYVDGSDCVYANVAGIKQGGSFFLRTVSRGCTTTNPRTVTLDFSEYASTNVGDCVNSPRSQGICIDVDSSGNVLDLCGSNAITDASFNVPSLFRTPQLSPLAVDVDFNLSINLGSNFNTRVYRLRYQDAVVWDATATNARAIRGMHANLLKIVPKSTQYPNGFKCLGEYNMPFEQTVTK